MGFKPAPNIKGRVFVPDETEGVRKKHSCRDCYQCQMCSEDRCQVCRNAHACELPGDLPAGKDGPERQSKGPAS